jgi:hypothetical protein
MERTDWLNEGFDSADARFLMVTAITHHRFGSPIWGEEEVRKLHEELAEIEAAAGGLSAALSGLETSGTVDPAPLATDPNGKWVS